MANATVKPGEVVTTKTPAEITLTLSAAELAVIAHLVGNVSIPTVHRFTGGSEAYFDFWKTLDQASKETNEPLPFTLHLKTSGDVRFPPELEFI